MDAIVLQNIVKTYNKGAVQAVKDVSFSVKKGELFGLIGADGAGKTTIFRMLTTLLLPDSGCAFVDQLDIVKDYKEIRKRVGYMPGNFSLYQDLSVEENLHFFARLFNTTIADNYHLIADIYRQLKPFKNRKVGKLSGGMKQKLALCCALIHCPSVLFLDEPTTGVDVVSRKEFWEMLKTLQDKGVSMLVSTPYMDEALRCERIALIQHGEILSIDRPQSIIEQFPYALFAVRADNMSTLLHFLRKNKKIYRCFSFGEYHHFTFQQNASQMSEIEQVQALNTELEMKNFHSIEIKKITPSIEDCFIYLMH